MNMYTVYIVNKKTKERTVLYEHLPLFEAESECESWGWNYCDENGVSYWIEYEEETR